MAKHILLWFSILNSWKQADSEEINTIIRNGAIFKKIDNVIIYEKYVPLYFEMP